MPSVRPILITPMSPGVSARRATIMAKKLGCRHKTIHEVGMDNKGRYRYHPCSSPQEFLDRYLKYVIKANVPIVPIISRNESGELVINL